MKVLNETNTPVIRKFPPKVMQFGGGNFLRAFTNWMIEVLNEETDFQGSSIIVKPTERGAYTDLVNQDGLFHIVLNGIEKGQLVSATKLITNVDRVEHPYQDWHGYLETATIPSIRFIISNTTEAGIKFDKNDAIDSIPSKEFPGKLTHWLFNRYEHFHGAADKGCIFLPCELIEENGKVLLECILQYAEYWGLESGFKDWVTNHNYFCDTLVDRIVSGFPADRVAALTEDIGFDDKLLVASEIYHSWVIEGDKIVQQELPFAQTKLNVQFVNDLQPYRTMKVKVLNGAHTALVPVGYLTGFRLVAEVMENESLSCFVEQLLLEEVAPTIELPQAEVKNFINDVLDRFKNQHLKHKLISISLNSTSKFVTRLLPTLLDYLQIRNELPKRIVLSLAALIRFYKGSIGDEIIQINDNPTAVTYFKQSWTDFEAGTISLEKMVENILGNEAIWQADLSTISGLGALTSDYLKQITRDGMAKVAKEVAANHSVT